MVLIVLLTRLSASLYADGVDSRAGKSLVALFLIWGPCRCSTAEKEIIRALKNLAKKAESVIIGTDLTAKVSLLDLARLPC